MNVYMDGCMERELGKLGNVLELSICIPELEGGEKKLEMR